MTPSLSDYVLRPVRVEDIDATIAMIDTLTDSITSLPRDPALIEKRVHKSVRAFYPRISEPGDEQYLFVLEGPQGIVGTSGVIARVGGYEPFYTFEVVSESFTHEPLDIAHSLASLRLKANHDGPSEMGSLYLRPDCRGAGVGRLLSLGRFPFMAQYPERFGQQILVELRGYLDDAGKSPFWENVARVFFEQEFNEADFLSGLGNKSFIRDLMPRHPLYIPLLPEAARKVIGKVHRDTRPARALLETEGFAPNGEVDIFDGGPVLLAHTANVRGIRDPRSLVIESLADEADLPETPLIVSNGELDFRAVMGRVREVPDGRCVLAKTAAELLRRQPGDTVTVLSSKPAKN